MKNEGDRVERKETRRHVLLSAVDPEDRYFDSGRDTPEEIARKDVKFSVTKLPFHDII